ncbi:hypothetical protein [Pseudotenacibaculum haliotis]|uniref:Uncharacterized protein n=1 Tax=Pseudotenacibaculum haliotis TaxID=1862138 RepID=A0ABW5LR11_9FLAO
MKTQKLLLSLLVILLPFYVNAQETNLSRAGTTGIGIDLSSWEGMTFRNSLTTSNSRVGNKSLETFYESVTGVSPYINDTFMPAKVNNFKQIATARYDAYKDLFVVKINESKSLYLEKRLGNRVTFIATKEMYQVFYDEEEKARFFKIEKMTPHFSLLIKQEIVLRGGEKPRSSYDKYVAPFFKRTKDKLYLSLDNRLAVKAPTSKKKFFKLFKDEAGAIKSFVKKNKLNIKEKSDILRILNYYATL